MQEGQLELDLPGIPSVLELRSGGKDIRVQEFLPERNRYLFLTAWELKNMIRKEESLHGIRRLLFCDCLYTEFSK